MAKRWSKKDTKKLGKLRENNYTRREIAGILGKKPIQIKDKVYKEVKKGNLGYVNPEKSLMRVLGNHAYLMPIRYLRQESKKFTNLYLTGKKTRILYIADPHLPFQSNKDLDYILKNEDADICIFSELLDMYSVSRFRKDQMVNLKDELYHGRVVLEKFAKKYKTVLFDDSNHMQRLDKLFQDRFADKPEIIELFGKNMSVFDLITAGLKNVHAVESWYIKIGKTIFVHPHWNSKIPGRASKNSWEYFTSIGENFDALVTAHTHKLDMHLYMRKWLIQAPCICEPMMYINEGRNYNAEHMKGYTIVTLDKEGNFLPNESRPYFLGWE